MKPIIVVNPKLLSVLTFGFASGLTLWPFIILKKMDDGIIRHEKIHIKQQEEMLVIFFYFWYVVEWFLKVFKYRGRAYRNISFEKEAYSNAKDTEYLKTRKRYAWFRYF